MVDDHEDYETGAAPAAHKLSHQAGGTDEITVEGLAGELAAEQKSAWAKVSGKPVTFTPSAHKLSHQNGGADKISVAGLLGETAELGAHKILPAIHHAKFTAAEARAAINNIFGADGKADADIDLDTHKLLNVVDPATDQGGDTKKARNDAISTHAGLPTVHQDAPALIETHRLVAGAHHAKYTDAEARAVHSPISIHPSSLTPEVDTLDYNLSSHYMKARTTLAVHRYFTQVYLPPGVTVTKFTLYGFRDDALATMIALLYRNDRAHTSVAMAQVTADWITGYSSKFDDSISSAVVDNDLYSYVFYVTMTCNDHVNDLEFTGAKIAFTC